MSLDLTPGQRISVVGTTGAGKTTLARQLAERLGLAHIELDALFWDRDWTPVPEEVFRERVRRALAGERWVVDGNYSRIQPEVWARADTVVFLDYSFARVLWQLLLRTWRRAINDEELWSGNRESLRKSFLSRDSIVWWMLTTYHRKRKRYRGLIQEGAYPHLRMVHLRSPRSAAAWLAKLEANTSMKGVRDEIQEPG